MLQVGLARLQLFRLVKRIQNKTQIRFTEIDKYFTLFTKIFDWFPALGRLRVSPPSLWTYGETIQMKSYTFKPKMDHRTPRDHLNSRTAYILHIT